MDQANLEFSLNNLEQKRESMFRRMNKLYECSKKITCFDHHLRSNEDFLIESGTIDDIYIRYEAVVDEIVQLRHAINPDYRPENYMLEPFEDLFIRVKGIRERINNHSNATPSRIENVTTPEIKLPSINLPKFDGRIENWAVFYDSFSANIHNNKHLTDSQRVQYLMGCLVNNALKITAGIVPTSDTYKIIWESLIKKYQDKRVLGLYYLNNVLDIKSCSRNSASLDSFIEKYAASMSALKQLEIPDLSDFILLHCALRKIDTQTVQDFEQSVRDVDIPTSKQLVCFVQDQVKILERSNPSHSNFNSRNINKFSSDYTPRNTRMQVSKSFVTRERADKPIGLSSDSSGCLFCKDPKHRRLDECNKFKNLNDAKKRYEFVKSKHGCTNCLNLRHRSFDCRSTSVCNICKKRHHYLLHFEKENNTPIKNSERTDSRVVTAATLETSYVPSMNPISSASICRSTQIVREDNLMTSRSLDTSGGIVKFTENMSSDKDKIGVPFEILPNMNSPNTLSGTGRDSTILLATVQVYAHSVESKENGDVFRCLLDNGSQHNLITTECCRKLNLTIMPLRDSVVKGIGSSSSPIIGHVHLEIESRVYPDKKYVIYALVLERITDRLPFRLIKCNHDIKLQDLPLADLTWNVPGEIDIILGAQLFPYIYLGNKIEIDSRLPLTLSTTFGYVFMGDYPIIDVSDTETFTALTIHESIQRFWELEEIPKSRFLSPEETECENMYRLTTKRDDSGRFSVSLPFSQDPSELGKSYLLAHSRLMSLERKLRRSVALRQSYNSVIQEYIDKGYLSSGDDAQGPESGYYIPHHAVFRSDKTIPRIVLDASARTSTGLSLNDVLHVGPNLQTDLFVLLLNFRLFPIAMNADIKQMYLRIGVNEEHQKYLRILFRFDESETVRTFTFIRLPFGLKPSPYLAMRSVKQLSTDMSPQYPVAAKIAETSLYMDDLVYSAEEEEVAIQLAKDLIFIFKSADFDLIKWSSNSSYLLDNLPGSHRKLVEFDANNNSQKILGLVWDPQQDNFQFTADDIINTCTKRSILSVVARLFDVLGLVAPIILYAKLMIKELWLDNCNWDDPAPERIRTRFLNLIREFPLLNSLRIPRHIGASSDCQFRLVAFCDASLNGYGCVVYAHCTNSSGIRIKLLCAKSKVSPTKITTIARLELCAALLMSKLIKVVRDTYSERIPIAGIYAFSDSTVALSWIHSSPHRWSIFVSNRVAQCHENLDSKHFYHVAGVDNPSDCLSRGMLPSQLVAHDLWWNGPAWIRQPFEDWQLRKFSPINSSEIPEYKTNAFVIADPKEQPILCELAKRISVWEKLLRTVVYVLKFSCPRRNIEINSVTGLMEAELAVLKAVQLLHFSEDIHLINSEKLPSNRLKSLAVFIDERGLLRIGGRLSNSELPYEAKYPILLPKCDHVVNLIIQHYHTTNCHAGPSLLMSILRQKFWILNARSVIRSRVRECNNCFKTRPVHFSPRMADLPSCRVSETKAFVHTGVDYTGSIRITLTRRRGQHTQKAYICLFVCLVTKAVHIELVSDMTTDSFLSAFKRFISRRGPVSCLYSDNGKQFVGAKIKLNELHNFLFESDFNATLLNELKYRRIEWKMIPPRAPNFGGIWEANIKSLKTHLHRVIGNQILTYEELQTLLIQIECVMNSRPLNLISSDPELEALTPAHFLMSTPLKYLPASDLSKQNLNLIQRKRLLDGMVQSFWKKWHLEYLHTLQIRQKWLSSDKPAEVGTVVIVEMDKSLPLNWPLGIIVETFKGSDNVIRVANVKTKFGLLKRPVTKLYPLPTQ